MSIRSEIHDHRPPVNVGDGERLASLVGGSLLTVAGLRRGSAVGTVMALVGGVLAARGLTGHCPLYSAMDRRHATGPDDPGPARRYTRHPGDIHGTDCKETVDEAAEESFPASDPPSFSPGKA
ncbi:hypothetical protein M2352_002781 [Azospirillum fermentarium]|uniref:YgaP family membrane protein n=1 Tax=Azospirillum fermentarium TaxID=1233114 RepID=UPI0022265CFC|nr:DUF2892 domain-containing protein [Azospirillum fermentarium]MCW2247190.1 hypothetical protein [Azospirillum fermentarium]